jgi:uncharacterized tellurite resistance protein B-like protein
LNSNVVITQASFEGIIIVIIIYAAFWIFSKVNQNKRDEEIASIPPLTLEVEKGVGFEKFKLGDVECFNLRIKGWINNPRTYQDKIKLIFHAYDNTDLEKDVKVGLPLISNNNVFQDEKSRVFKIQTTWETTADTYLPNWYEFISIPCENLIPPLKGNREIMFRVIAGEPSLDTDRGFIDGEDTKKVIHWADSTIAHKFNDLGYTEYSKNREKLESLSVEIAVAFATVEGDLQKKTLDIIKKWIVDITSNLEENKIKVRKDALSDVLKSAYKNAKAKKISVSSILNEMNNNLSKSQKYEIIELLLNIAGADDKLSEKENVLLDKIIKKLEIDEAVFSNMKNKTVINIGEIETSRSTSESIFGIKEEMTNEEKCKLLRKNYSKWNAQTNSNNQKTKTRAKEMVKLIAQLREKYNC